MTKDTSGPAFPRTAGNHHRGDAGMTLRQYAAIKAMQGLLADGMDCPEYVAMRAVKAADALLADLEK